ncbi:hypothetical protein ACFQU9_15405 [Actinomadura namibiensis]|uniref:Uncharacterized protein n=1 Tax=Actinomadura namibiensis TaxID=182080 RepID=A0A7W3LSH0_ACTNM|nr:hypothetical protein [Actinomadura namibiensis]MBA8953468.1 hypothetical protein [Actinomadura namibiensis]
MRVRKVLMGAGVAAMVIGGFSVAAEAAAWKPWGLYGSKRACVDAGQQYVRENFDAYKCTEQPGGYMLWLK